ncbi:sterol O-acyltransferase 1-like [Zophobas morio]|uniref:sterol O-acyltransferase 1-like n=1 Tax=Zophobas morio TaxID=2755281 RepID=UPI003083AF4E
MEIKNGVQKKSPRKEFKIRDALLTTKFENSEDGRTIYNIFVVIFAILLTYTGFDEYTKTGKVRLSFHLIWLGFKKLDLAILVWCTSNILACLSYTCFKFWAKVRLTLEPKGQKVWDKIWSMISILYYFLFLYGLQAIGHTVKFGKSSATFIFMEQVRLLMKQHAFIRTNVPQVLRTKMHTETNLELPNFGQFFYFLFAPTIIYKDEYPRTRHIRWKFVLHNIAEMFAAMWFYAVIVEKFLILRFNDICLRQFTLGEIIAPIFSNILPGVLFMLLSFYGVLHSCQNAFAEILRFGDRMFYKEWWHSKSLAEFHRTWNILVQDWLYTYIYKEFYELIIPKNKKAAGFVVFFVSAVVHEWLMINVFRFFLPINFILFLTISAVLTAVDISYGKWGNFLVLYGITIGLGIEANLFALETFAHDNCPLNENITSMEFYIPRFIRCGCIK